jgi:hypothetical protein
VNWVKDHILPVPAPGVAGDHIATTANGNLIDIAPDPDVTVAIGNRHRVIIGFISHQGLRVYLAAGLITGIKRRRRQIHHGIKVTDQTLPNALAVTAQDIRLTLAALRFKPKVEGFPCRKMRDGHHEVAPGVSDQTLNSAFIVALSRTPIAIMDEVMRQEPAKQLGPFARTIRQDLRDQASIIVIESLLTGRWITDKRNLIITGPCGVGKTWLGCALAQMACRESVTVVYKRMPRLFEELELAHGDGRFPRLFRSITKSQLLILDDWGPDRLTATQRRDLMEIVEERYGRGSTMITSQLPIKAWHDVIGEPTFADAILDRTDHNAYSLELDGQSMRKTITKMDDENPQT